LPGVFVFGSAITSFLLKTLPDPMPSMSPSPGNGAKDGARQVVRLSGLSGTLKPEGLRVGFKFARSPHTSSSPVAVRVSVIRFELDCRRCGS
jgi:hypothetical protein